MKPKLLDRLTTGRVLKLAVDFADWRRQQLQETVASSLFSTVQFVTLAATTMVLVDDLGISVRFHISGEPAVPVPLFAGGLLLPAS